MNYIPSFVEKQGRWEKDRIRRGATLTFGKGEGGGTNSLFVTPGEEEQRGKGGDTSGFPSRRRGKKPTCLEERSTRGTATPSP